MTTLDLQVDRSDLHRTELVRGPLPAPADGEALLAIEHFAFTANNVTYAALGERLSYWRFFPAPDPWGRIPVWGFARVVASRSAAAPEGARFYGFYPMSSHVVVAPEDAGSGNFVDGRPHRRSLPMLYNLYRAAPEPDPGEALEMLLRPLFATGFLLDHHLAGRSEAVLLSSASSKVAASLAAILAARGGRPVLGLTSPRNRAFVERLGVYDRVLTYDEVEALPADAPVVYVDLSGDAALRRRLHGRLAGLRDSIVVGDTHWDASDGQPEGAALPGPAPAFFFAPTVLAELQKAWGPGGLRARLDEAWRAFRPRAEGWYRIAWARGPEAVARVYAEVLGNLAPADVGYILSLAP